MASLRLPGRAAPQQAVAEKPKTTLEKRRDELRTTFTEMQWDLGGAAYEMAARDYFRLDVLAKMAAKLQVVDAELAEIERVTRLEEAGAAGICAGCGSLHARGAVYCWRCGRNVAQAQGSSVVLPAGTTRPPVVPAPVPAARQEAPAVRQEAQAVRPEAQAVRPEAPVARPEAPVVQSAAAPPPEPEIVDSLPDIEYEPIDSKAESSDLMMREPEFPDEELPDAGLGEPEVPDVEPGPSTGFNGTRPEEVPDADEGRPATG